MDDTTWDAVDRAVAANELHRPVEVGPEVVTRPAGEHTATVHSYLRHLRAKGLSCVPEPLGVVDGVEHLRFIDGEDGGQGWYHQHTDQGLASAARLLRHIHDAGSDWEPPAGAVWGAPAEPGDDIVLCHGDPGPWNFIWHDNEAVALIDWDYLHPAPRLSDVAYALRWFAPLRSDEHALHWHHFPVVPDRPARVRTFVAAYGDLPPFDVADAVIRRIRSVIALVADLADRGVEPQRTWVADGANERDLEEIAWIEAHRSELAVGTAADRHIVVAAVALVRDGCVLTVRKRGTERFMLVGGKLEPGESPLDAALRETYEEVGLRIDSATLLGEFHSEAANEPGHSLHSTVFTVESDEEPVASAEIAEVRWTPLRGHADDLAPMLAHHVLPVLLEAVTKR